MHIVKQNSQKLIIRRYPKFCWTVSCFCGFGFIFNHLSGLQEGIEMSFSMLATILIVNAFADVLTFDFDVRLQRLTIRQWRIWRETLMEYSLLNIEAVRLSTQSVNVSGYGGTGSRIELVYNGGDTLPLTSSYSSDGSQRNIVRTIATLLDV